MKQEEMRRRIEQMYRDVIATTPVSETFSSGRLADAYVHGIYMVQEHTVALMAQRMVELLQEIRREEVDETKEYIDEPTGIKLIVKRDNPEYPGSPKLTIVCAKAVPLVTLNEAISRLQELAHIQLQHRMPPVYYALPEEI